MNYTRAVKKVRRQSRSFVILYKFIQMYRIQNVCNTSAVLNVCFGLFVCFSIKLKAGCNKEPWKLSRYAQPNVKMSKIHN